MCLSIQQSSMRHIRGRMKKTGSVICYKILNQGLYSPIRCQQYHSGFNYSYRQVTDLFICEKESDTVNNGLHVYTSKKQALLRSNRWNIIIPVRCYLKDFVAAGHKGAVFTKVFIRKHDIRKYTK